MMHWSEQYIGMQWDAKTFNCADLAALVQREQFGHAVQIEGAHSPDFKALDAAIRAGIDTAAFEVQVPKDGDGVLIRSGSLLHVGIYCEKAIPAVLHNVNKAGVVCHAVRDLARYGFVIEGYYTWK